MSVVGGCFLTRSTKRILVSAKGGSHLFSICCAAKFYEMLSHISRCIRAVTIITTLQFISP